MVCSGFSKIFDNNDATLLFFSQIFKIISELPTDQKNVIMMRLYKNMSFKEIADISGVSINTALGRMRYAIINIRKLIEQHQIVLSAYQLNPQVLYGEHQIILLSCLIQFRLDFF